VCLLWSLPNLDGSAAAAEGASHHARWLTVRATAYCTCKRCCGPKAQGRTRTGRNAVGTKGIAVDPSVIALGSRLDVPGYGSWVLADDTGSAIVGDKIDLRMADHDTAKAFGVQELRIRVWTKEK
jgi:3D (Asp-Asp-Asp) domain-containing protein